MLIGEVVGAVTSTIKVPTLTSRKLLIVEPIEGYSDGERLVAVDLIGVGRGERVLVVRGAQVANVTAEAIATDAVIVGTVERVESD